MELKNRLSPCIMISCENVRDFNTLSEAGNEVRENMNGLDGRQDGEKSTLSNMVSMGENMPGGFFVYRADEEEELLYANDVLLDIYGCRTLQEFKELTGFTFRGMIHPDDYEMVKKSIHEQVKKSDRNLDFVEYRILKRDGEIRWVDAYGRLAETVDYGAVYSVFVRDITDIHFDREENKRRMEVIEGLSKDYTSIYLFNLDSGSMYPYRQENDRFRRIEKELGIASGEMFHGKQIFSIYAERHVLQEDRMLYMQETMSPRIRIRLGKEDSYTVNYRCFNGDGEITYMEMFLAHIESEESGLHVVMGYRDVTEHILHVQEELANRLNMEMELEREKKANEIKSSFLFNISHDIRTPMNAIMGFTDLAVRHVGEPELLKAYLGRVKESNQHMLALIDDLLEMSRIDYGRIEINPEPCNLLENIRLVLDMYRPQAEKKNVFFVEVLELPEEKVYADALCFRRILGNLISNAVKFTPEEGTVKISARRKDMPDGEGIYEFSVSDSGVGMTEEFMKRMFVAFEREENSTESGYEGTGLGLAIAKHLLDAMDGSISVKSKKGEGSVFKVEIPFEPVGQVMEQNGEKVKQKSGRKAPKKRRILLVEDIEMNRILAEELLSEEGFLVESVQDGRVAVETIKNHSAWYYDLVLMDIQMPVMNGYEAARLIRSMGREDSMGVPIIALSANAHDEDKKKSMESGMNSHVAKPFDIDQLVRTINKYLE